MKAFLLLGVVCSALWLSDASPTPQQQEVEKHAVEAKNEMAHRVKRYGGWGGGWGGGCCGGGWGGGYPGFGSSWGNSYGMSSSFSMNGYNSGYFGGFGKR
ncbi:hypothetical protein Aduo_006994 [Ancylostoma duodenale]